MKRKIKIKITSSGNPIEQTQSWLLKRFHCLEELLKKEKYTLVDSPVEADLIIFTGGALGEHNEWIKRNEVYKLNKKKSYVISDTGKGIKTIKGIYTSISKNEYNPRIHRAGWYFPTEDLQKYSVENKIKHGEKIRCSFRGDIKTHKVRKELHSMNWRNLKFTNTDGIQVSLWNEFDQVKLKKIKNSYIEEIMNSDFVLCPRGYNVSSMRVYEVMSLGRVPIIISDDWVRPAGPRWEEFSITVKENDIEKIESRINMYKDSCKVMGENARLNWEKWFSPNVYAKNVINIILDLANERGFSLPKQYLPFFNYKFLRYYIRSRRLS